MDLLKNLDVVDTEIQEAINKELSRQRDKLEMIASENIVSKAVMQAQGSVLTNKYAEGYPGKRYYGGCEYVDVVEQLAIDRAKKLFGAEYANVQPHSGAQANTAGGCGTRIVHRGQKPLALCDRCPCFGSLHPPLAALTFAASSIICAFGLAAAAPRSPYRHLELCGIALKYEEPKNGR